MYYEIMLTKSNKIVDKLPNVIIFVPHNTTKVNINKVFTIHNINQYATNL